MVELTASERKILRVLQKEGRISNQALAERVGLSAAPCWRRVQNLRESGVLRGYAAILDPQKVGVHVVAYAHINLQRHQEDTVERFEEAVRATPEILECYAVTGDADFLLKVAVPDIAAYDRFLHEFVFSLPGVGQVHSNLALREIKYETALPLDSPHG